MHVIPKLKLFKDVTFTLQNVNSYSSKEIINQGEKIGVKHLSTQFFPELKYPSECTQKFYENYA